MPKVVTEHMISESAKMLQKLMVSYGFMLLHVHFQPE